MATDWKAAIANYRLAHLGLHGTPIRIYNAEYFDRNANPASGFIEQYADQEHYALTNAHAHWYRRELTEDQVEQAMIDMNIARSFWLDGTGHEP